MRGRNENMLSEERERERERERKRKRVRELPGRLWCCVIGDSEGHLWYYRLQEYLTRCTDLILTTSGLGLPLEHDARDCNRWDHACLEAADSPVSETTVRWVDLNVKGRRKKRWMARRGQEKRICWLLEVDCPLEGEWERSWHISKTICDFRSAMCHLYTNVLLAVYAARGKWCRIHSVFFCFGSWMASWDGYLNDIGTSIDSNKLFWLWGIWWLAISTYIG